MYNKPQFTQVPNQFIEEELPNLLPSEAIIALIIARQTTGWHKQTECISIAQFIKKTGIKDNHTIIEGLRSLKEKGIIKITYECPNCKKITNTQQPTCPKCKSSEHQNKYYGLNTDYSQSENLEEPHEVVGKSHKEVVGKSHKGSGKIPQPTDLESLSDNVSQVPKETLKRNSLKEISQSEKLTNEDPEADWENFDILDEREREIFSEKTEPEEEKREERDFRTIKELEPSQTETHGTEGVNRFTAGLLAGIGNPSAFAEEKPREREDKSNEKEIKELLNSCMANGWNLQIATSDNEIVKEIMKFSYKDVEAACDDRLTKNRPNIPKVFPKWVLDGLRSGIKAKKLTQLEKEAYLENELEKHYQNGNGDKLLCRDVIKKLYSVVTTIGTMVYRYKVEMDWCEMDWADL